MERERETGGDESERTRDVSKCCANSSSVVINEEEGLLLGEIKKTGSHAPEASLLHAILHYFRSQFECALVGEPQV